MAFENNNADKCATIGMTLRSSSPALPFMSTLENKSGYLCCVLEDFLETNNNPRNYMDVPKEKRLETYFGRKPSRKKIEKRILDSVSRMKENKKRLAYEVEYIHFFQEEGDIFTKDLPFDCCFAHLIVEYAKNLARNGGSKKNVRYSFFSDFSSFRDSYILNRSNVGWVKSLEEKESLLDAGERLFVLLTDQWFFISDTLPDAKKYTTEQVVECVLGFMEAHPDSAYMDTGLAMSLFARTMRDKFTAAVKPVPAA